MAKNSFSMRFPFAGLFFVIAVALAIPLTVWSLNNVSTNTKQEAASPCNISTSHISCTGGYTCPSWICACSPKYRLATNGVSCTKTSYYNNPVSGLNGHTCYYHTLLDNQTFCGYKPPIATPTPKPITTPTPMPLTPTPTPKPITTPTPITPSKPPATPTPVSACAYQGGTCTSSTICAIEGLGILPGTGCAAGTVCCRF